MSETKPPGLPGDGENLKIQKAPAAQTAAAAVPMSQRGIQLQNLEDLLRFAGMCVEQGAAPKGMTQSQAAIAIQAGLERGLGTLGGLQAAVVINGVLSWRGWAAAGLIQNSPVIVPGTFKSWVDGDGDARTGYCRAQRRGYDAPFIRSFSMRDAKLAGLLNKGGPWQTRPDNMLEWRAIGDMGRFHFGDVLGGMPIDEDVLAGGIGPTSPSEMAKELPAELPKVKPAVKDPILAELVAGSQAPAIEVEAKVVEESARASGGVVGGAAPTPEVQAVINAQVDEVFAQPAPAELVDCPRCTVPLNAMGGCDVCGFPGADNGERPA